jgi:hypothetical protein
MMMTIAKTMAVLAKFTTFPENVVMQVNLFCLKMEQ